MNPSNEPTITLRDARYGQIAAAMQANKLEFIAPVQAITNSVTETTWDFDAAIPVAAPPAALTGELKAMRGYAGRAVKGVHVGPYDTIDQSAKKVAAWAAGTRPSAGTSKRPTTWPGVTIFRRATPAWRKKRRRPPRRSLR